MNRRRFLKSTAAIPLLPIAASQLLTNSVQGAAVSSPARRVRPGDPSVLDAFALAIIAGGGSPAFPGMPGSTPDLAEARRRAQAINAAMDKLLKIAPNPGSYVSESDFFERSWQQSFWGPNYARLAAVKRKYDPDGLFFVHQGVGSEERSADGFARMAGRQQ